MPQFRYRALTPAGEIVVGEVDAPSRDEVMRRIEYLGHLPIEAEAAVQGLFSGRARTGKSPRSRDVTVFLRQLALLIDREDTGLIAEANLLRYGEVAAGPIDQGRQVGPKFLLDGVAWIVRAGL